jgi:alpha-1,3-mannosyltransferase
VFEFKWTVNWKMLPEAMFLDKRWAGALLLTHVGTLLALGQCKFCREHGGIVKAVQHNWRRQQPAGFILV